MSNQITIRNVADLRAVANKKIRGEAISNKEMVDTLITMKLLESILIKDFEEALRNAAPDKADLSTDCGIVTIGKDTSEVFDASLLSEERKNEVIAQMVADGAVEPSRDYLTPIEVRSCTTTRSCTRRVTVRLNKALVYNPEVSL